jgi:hypothetical protein
MKKLIWIAAVVLLAACGDNSSRTGETSAAQEEEEVDIGSGEEINPQLELDSSETRFNVDSVNSTESVERESEPDDESF